MKKLHTGEEKIKKQVRFQTKEVEDVIEILKILKIENIKDDNLLPDSQPIISIVESILHEKETLYQLNKSIEILDRLDKKENANFSLIWASLLNNNVHPKSLVSILVGLIENHKSHVSFIASTIYLNLLILRGSEAYSIFDPVALNSIYNLIKSWIYCNTSKKEMIKSKEEDNDEEQNSDNEEINNERDMSIFSYEEVDTLLQKYYQFISLITLEYDSQGYYDAIDIATEITKIYIPDEEKSKRRKRGSSSSINSSLNSKLWKYGYDILESIMESYNDDYSKSTISVVFKSLLPNILIEDRKIDVKDATIDFLSSFMVDSKPYYNNACQCMVILMQHVCVKLSDNAQNRQHSLSSIDKMFSLLNNECKSNFIRFLDQYSRNRKSLYRLFSIDVASHALNHFSHLEILLEDDQQMIFTLLNILLSRSLDKVPNVRSKALMNISHVMESIANTNHMKDMFLDVMFPDVIRSTPTTTPMKKSNQGGLNLLSIVRRSIREDRAIVQRSALHVMEMIGICSFDGVKLNDDDISALKERCFDQFVSIRKQSVIALSELFMAYPDSIKIAAAWALSVPHLIFDTEQSIQDACVKYFKTLIIDRIIESNMDQSYIWDIIETLDTTMNGNKSILWKIIQFLYDKSKPPKKLTSSLQNMIKSHDNLGAWIMLANLSSYSPKDIQIKLIVSKWKEYRDNDKEYSKVLQKVLTVLNSVSKLMDKTTMNEVESELKERIEGLNMNPSHLNISLNLLMKIIKDPSKWINTILKNCSEALSSCVVSGKSSNNDQYNLTISDVEFYLRLVGELAQYTQNIPKPLVNVIEALITPTLKKIRIGNNQIVPLPETTVAYAFIALGMLCLEDQTLTKSSVPKFVRELEVSDSSTIRNNVMVILCNLCVRYTNIVEGYIGKISLCLKDSNELVRKQTLLLLSSLLQEDYIKPKNENIFFRLILSLVDESPSIQKYSLGCLETLLLKKDQKSNIFFTNFIDVIFYLNDNKLHPKYNSFNQSAKEREAFSLKGSNENRQKRMKIYKIFLDHLPDALKFQLSYNLCKEILSSIAYEQIPLKGSEEVLYDTLCILTSKEIKIKVSSIAKDDQEDIEEEKEDQTKIIDVKTKMINQIVKKNVVENIVPTIIELKHLLAKNHSPLLKNLLEYLKHLLKDYKDEISDILASDRRLAAELEYEMKKLEIDSSIPKIPLSNITNIHKTPISTPKTPRKLSSPSDMSKFSLPKLRNSPSTYQPTPGKPHKEEEDDEVDEESNIKNKRRKKKRKISIIMSPSIARMKQSNIFISKGRKEEEDDDNNNEKIEDEELINKRKREEEEEEMDKEEEEETIIDKRVKNKTKRRSVKVLKSKEEIDEEGNEEDDIRPLRRSKRTRS